MITSEAVIILFSVLFQFSAALYALWLIRLTGLKYSWILISIALFLMCVRRLIPLYYIFSNINHKSDLLNDVVGLFLSFLMLLGIYGIGAIFTERNQVEDKIKKLLSEKETILKEVHHRIKNNMNTIYGLLSLHSSSVKNSFAVSALEDACSRVKSMLMLYDKLYQSVDYNELSCAEYFPSLIDDILSNFPNRDLITIEKKIDDFILNTKKLQPLGIIINELLTNIMKYAFTSKTDGVIKVSATLTGNTALFIIADNGDGMPESINFENTTGFGMQLVSLLSIQIGGRIRVERNEGTKFFLEFPV